MDHSSHHHNHVHTPPATIVDHDGKMMGGDHSMHMHAMSFHFGTMETILFDFWKTEGPGGIIISSLLIFLFCFLYETTKFVREYRKVKRTMVRSSETVEAVDPLKFSPRLTLTSLCDIPLHGLQVVLAYCLMLIFMTFNVWLCMAVVVGEVLCSLFYSIAFPYLDLFQSQHC